MREFEGKTILIVDDEEDLRENLALYLGMKGAKILEASDGLQALALLHTQKVDGIISDIRMPKMGGDLLLDEVKRKNAYEPVVFLVTGFADIAVEDALNRGAEALIRKPYSLERLCTDLHRALTRMVDQGRRSPRFEDIQSIRIFLGHAGQEKECETLNMGRGGLFVKVADTIPNPGDTIHFVLEAKIANQENGLVRGTGICRWIRTAEECPDQPGFGMEFTEIEKESYPLLVSMIAFYKTNSSVFIPKNS